MSDDPRQFGIPGASAQTLDAAGRTRFVRPDWRRHVRPGFERDHPFALYEQKYDPNQPRVPAGDPAGGQWTSDSSSGGLPTRQLTDAVAALARGHHKVPRQGLIRKNIDCCPTRQKQSSSNRRWAVYKIRRVTISINYTGNTMTRSKKPSMFLRTNGISPEKMTADQARLFVREITVSDEPRTANSISA